MRSGNDTLVNPETFYRHKSHPAGRNSKAVIPAYAGIQGIPARRPV